MPSEPAWNDDHYLAGTRGQLTGLLSLLGDPQRLIASWEGFRANWEGLGASWEGLRASWEGLSYSWEMLRPCWDNPGAS